MKIRLKQQMTKPLSEFEAGQLDYVKAAFGSGEFEPLGLTTTQIQPMAYLMTEDEYGTGLGYLASSIFEVSSHNINPNWHFYYYSENVWGSRLDGPRFFWGLQGLEDEKLIESFLNRDNKESVDKLLQILGSAGFR